jgi:hypothetical protein
VKTRRKRNRTRLNGEDTEARQFCPLKAYRDILSKETRERLEVYERRAKTEHKEVRLV